MADQTVAEVLNLSADYLERHGWLNDGRIGSELDGPRCTIGALGHVTGDLSMQLVHHPAYRTLREFVGDSVGMWNDRQTELPVVIETLRAAALIAAASEVEARLLEGPRATPPTAAPAVVDTAGARL